MARSKRIGRALLRRHPVPLHSGDKNARGTVLIVAGSPRMPGPVLLAAAGALRAGAGKLQIATAPEIALHVATAMPEALVVEFEYARARMERADAVVIGPGMDASADTERLLQEAVHQSAAKLVVDAAALAPLCERPDALQPRASQCVLTPHAGELCTMLGVERDDIEEHPRRAAVRAVERFGAVVAVKGEKTYVAAPGSRVFRNERGHGGLATSGSGDTLAGIIGGLLARGADPLQAAIWGVYVHAKAGERLGDRIGIGFLAREIPGEVPHVLRDLNGSP